MPGFRVSQQFLNPKTAINHLYVRHLLQDVLL